MYEQFVVKKVYSSLIGQIIENNLSRIDHSVDPIEQNDVAFIEEFLIGLQEFLLEAHNDALVASDIIALLSNFETLGLGTIHLGFQATAYLTRLDLTDLGKSVLFQLCDLNEAQFEYDEEQACYIRISFIEDIMGQYDSEYEDEEDEDEEDDDDDELAVPFLATLLKLNRNKN